MCVARRSLHVAGVTEARVGESHSSCTTKKERSTGRSPHAQRQTSGTPESPHVRACPLDTGRVEWQQGCVCTRSACAYARGGVSRLSEVNRRPLLLDGDGEGHLPTPA
eukprot:6205052-Pleurochrysis_carterae.AAC.2